MTSIMESHGTDRNGNSLKINYEGVDTKELSHFGGLDTHINVTKHLIESTLEPMHFAESAGDFLIGDKVMALYLNELGEFYRHCHSNSEAWDGYSNIEIVKYFLKEQLSIKEVAAIIEKDNFLIKSHTERIEKLEDEVWNFED